MKKTKGYVSIEGNSVYRALARLALLPSLIHCKKRLAVNIPSTAGMPLIKLSLDRTNLIIPGQGDFDK
jgi:hypothetical protein